MSGEDIQGRLLYEKTCERKECLAAPMHKNPMDGKYRVYRPREAEAGKQYWVVSICVVIWGGIFACLGFSLYADLHWVKFYIRQLIRYCSY